MTLSLIINAVFAALVLVAIPGLLAWAIRTSRNDNPPHRRVARRSMPHPSFTGSGLSLGHGQRPGGRAPAQDAG
jgi:hypothetical protein